MATYYSFRFFASSLSTQHVNAELIELADEMCTAHGTTYTHLGYVLLHPDYDYKDIGRQFDNDNHGRIDFIAQQIPFLYKGKSNEYAAPIICFSTPHPNNDRFPIYELKISFPTKIDHPIIIGIDIRDESKDRFRNERYDEILNMISKHGFKVRTAYLHNYKGEMKRFVINGIMTGFCTWEERQMMSGILRHRFNYLRTIPDAFLINTLPTEAISLAMNSIEKLLGEDLVSHESGLVTFRLGQSSSIYLLNRFFPTLRKTKLRRILKRYALLS